MDNLTIAGIVVGSVLIAVYLLYGYRNGVPVDLGKAAIIFIASSGVFAGVKVMIFTFNTELQVLIQTEGIDITHIFLGGLAISWVSILSAIQVFKTIPQIVSDAETQSVTNAEQTREPTNIG